MIFTRTITSTEMRGINRTAVLDLVRRAGPISRTTIAEQLDLSIPTIMHIVEELTAEKLVRETGSKEWSGGRRRSLIEFNANGHLVIGIDMGGTKVFGAVSDLSGKIYTEINIPNHGTRGEDSYLLLRRMITELMSEGEKTGIELLGIGIGIPGTSRVVGHGQTFTSAALNWLDFPLEKRLASEFALPVVVENDVNLAAMGELWFGSFPTARNLVLITVGTGIGAGIIVDGAIYKGSHNAAGEIGFIAPYPSALDQTYTGFGPLELMASGTGIAGRAKEIIREQNITTTCPEPSAEDVFEAARQGEEWARQTVAETVNLLAMGLSAVTLCFDPDVIVMGGGVARSADLLIEPLRRRLEGRVPVLPEIVPSALGYRAGVMGTIMNLLYHTADFYVVRKLA